MTICVVDDEMILAKRLISEIDKYLSSLSIKAKFLYFESPVKFLECDKSIDLLFLDLDMPVMDGIEAGCRFRQKDKKCKIIIETSRDDRMKEVFPLEIFRFLSKPYKTEEIHSYLDSFLKTTVGSDKITVYQSRIPYELYQNEICYVRAYDSDCEVVADSVYRSENSIRSFTEILDDRLFFQANKSVIVNFSFVEGYNDGNFTINGEEFSVSRRKKKSFEEKLKEYNLYYS